MIKMKNRLGIYFIYDEKGIMDEYAFFFLSEFKKLLNRLVVVINGQLKSEYIDRLKSLNYEVLVRENTGLDVYAYKCAFDYIDFNHLSDYDEVVYCNSTFFGPIYNFEDMFSCMDKNEDLDFWGITQHPDYLVDNEDIPAFKINPYGYLPKHIQHYFMVYRNSFVKKKDLFDFWNNLSEINDYFDSVGLFETVFTKHFEDLGYKWDTYVKYENENMNYPLLYKPYDVVTKYKCPIVKRKSFYLENDLTSIYNTKKQTLELLDYLKTNNLYDVSLIIDDINRII